MINKLFAAILFLFFTCSVQASPVTITFDPPTLPGGSRVETSYTESGMIFTGRFASTDSLLTGASFFPDNGTGYLHVPSAASNASLSFQMANSSLFDLLSIDLAEYSTVFPVPRTITFTGHKADASTVTASFTTDGIIDGQGLLVDFETFSFGSSFRDLAFVSADSTLFSLDNLQINPVPIPAAAWLFGSALIGLTGFSRRRKTVWPTQK